MSLNIVHFIVSVAYPYSELVFSRGDPRWLKALGSDVRHYLYPVHPSEAMLSTTTLAAALYLLLMRFMARQYAEVFR